ncbi:hypothetical protein COOONC_24714 [Cooperia oncophora]
MVFIATGPLYKKEFGQIFMTYSLLCLLPLFCLSPTVFSIVISRHHLFEHFMTPMNLSIIVFVNGAIFVNWVAVIFVVYWPNKEFTEHISNKAREDTGLDPFECAQIGLSIVSLSLLIRVVFYQAFWSFLIRKSFSMLSTMLYTPYI